MKLSTNFKYCSICLREKPLTKEHIIPQSIGGTLESYIQCKDCNSDLGTKIISKVKEAAEIRVAIKNLGKELPELFQSIEDGQNYYVTNIGGNSVDVKFKNGQFQTKFTKKKDDSLILDTHKGEKNIREMLAKNGLSSSEIEHKIDLFKTTPNNKLFELAKNISVIKWTTEPPCQSFKDAPDMDTRVVVLMAYNYFCLLLGELIFDNKLNFIRRFIKNGENSSCIKVERLFNASRKYETGHIIYPEFDCTETRIKIFLFGYICYVVHFLGIICKVSPRANTVYCEDLKNKK